MNQNVLAVTEQICRWITTALYCALLAKKIWTLDYWEQPAFTTYLAFIVARLLWSPHTLKQAMFIEPWTLCLRLCCLLEAVRLCSPRREIRWILTIMAGVAALAVLRLHSYPWPQTPVGTYRAICQAVNVGLAGAALMGLWYVRKNPHYLILAAHLILIAGFSFSNLGPRPGDLYRELHIWFFAGSSVCVALWLRTRSLIFERIKSP
jgi:hypothetical protein